MDGDELRAAVTDSGAPYVLINVWATWCEPCKAELPDFVRLERTWRPRGLQVWFVTTDGPEEYAEALQILRTQQARPPFFAKRGKDAPFIDAVHPDWNGTLPATCLVDARGQTVAFWDGPVPSETLHEVLEALPWPSS